MRWLHVIYIPLCLVIGAVVGWTLAASRQEAELARLRERVEADERRQAERRLEQSRGGA
ncbi:MAG: hypothetical protein IPG96_04125 [Proteobacteria bacterium]|jgi:hypothetical protein|nr:hypothetical protein [Pseudomonadota bacterium]